MDVLEYRRRLHDGRRDVHRRGRRCRPARPRRGDRIGDGLRRADLPAAARPYGADSLVDRGFGRVGRGPGKGGARSFDDRSGVRGKGYRGGRGHGQRFGGLCRPARDRLGEEGVGGLLRRREILLGLFVMLRRLVASVVEFGFRSRELFRGAILRVHFLRPGDLCRDGVRAVHFGLGQLPLGASGGKGDRKDKQRKEKKVPVSHFAPPPAFWIASAENFWDFSANSFIPSLSPSSFSCSARPRYASAE